MVALLNTLAGLKTTSLLFKVQKKKRDRDVFSELSCNIPLDHLMGWPILLSR